VSSVDGCKKGWCAVLLGGDTDELEVIACEVRPSFQDMTDNNATNYDPTTHHGQGAPGYGFVFRCAR
jgi:predicted RNase H-like nuclease